MQNRCDDIWVKNIRVLLNFARENHFEFVSSSKIENDMDTRR